MNKIIEAIKISQCGVLVAVCIITFTFLTSCGRQVTSKAENKNQAYSVAVVTYENKGLKIPLPTDWSLLHDESGIIADRTVTFETPEASRITLYFYKSKTRTYSDLANDLEQQLSLRNNKAVKHFEREAVEFGDYRGLKIGWISIGLTETENEATILQLQADPYPVIVQFHLFDDDIQTQKTNIFPFLHGISFDPQGVIL